MTTIKLETLNKIRDNLRSLTFDVQRDSARKTADEKTYLNYYGIDCRADFPKVQHRFGYFPAGNFHIASHYWLPKKPQGTVFIVHGYFDHVGLYGHLIRYLLEKNYAVVAFDLPGHGLSSGERISIASFDHYVDVFSDLLHGCEQHFPSPWHAVGQSTGGAILLKYVLAEKPKHYENSFQKIALLAPLIQPRAQRVNLLFYQLTRRFLKRLKRIFLINSGDKKFCQFIAEKDPLQDRYIPFEFIGAMKRWAEEFDTLPPSDFPIRVVQGDADATVDWRYNLKGIQEKFPNASINMIAGAQHHLVNEAKGLRKRVLDQMGL